MNHIYFIGGSPCSGKSTVAEILSRQYDLYYFKVDERLDAYTRQGTLAGYEICKKQMEMSAEQIWMRDPVLQCREEFLFYDEINDFLMEDLFRVQGRDIITEGAAYMPHLMRKFQIPVHRYVSITPAPEFQNARFKERNWIPCVLEGCSDMEKAFENWMNRDVLFARKVERECEKLGYLSIKTDGGISIEDLVGKVSAHFGLMIDQ